jgi:hypothetical protein
MNDLCVSTSVVNDASAWPPTIDQHHHADCFVREGHDPLKVEGYDTLSAEDKLSLAEVIPSDDDSLETVERLAQAKTIWEARRQAGIERRLKAINNVEIVQLNGNEFETKVAEAVKALPKGTRVVAPGKARREKTTGQMMKSIQKSQRNSKKTKGKEKVKGTKTKAKTTKTEEKTQKKKRAHTT